LVYTVTNQDSNNDIALGDAWEVGWLMRPVVPAACPPSDPWRPSLPNLLGGVNTDS
jgi:hypothetical protein